MTRHSPPQLRTCAPRVLGSFRVDFATGDDARFDEHRLRYAAFVQEHGWEQADACPGGLERDIFDVFSCSVLLTDPASGEPVACQRLILPDDLPPGLRTNVEQQCRPLDAAFDFAALPRDRWAEASRLTIARGFRCGGRAASRQAFAAVMHASLALAVALGRSTVFALSDPRTATLTRRLGFEIHQVGEVVEFHGPRAVFRIDPAEVAATVPEAARGEVTHLVDEARRVVAGRNGHHTHYAA